MATISPRQECSVETDPGIVMFGGTMQVWYANQRAKDLIAQTKKARSVAAVKQRDLPWEIVQLGSQIRERIHADGSIDGWNDLAIDKTIQTMEGAVRLYGFGIPDPDGMTPWRIMIVIEECPTEPSRRWSANDRLPVSGIG
ncbi:MAG: hypothetical protein ACT4OO_01730 [Nitrospiraceae bacterium]